MISRMVGNTYDTEFEVYADGYRFKLVDPYGTPRLYIRRPGVAEEGKCGRLAAREPADEG